MSSKTRAMGESSLEPRSDSSRHVTSTGIHAREDVRMHGFSQRAEVGTVIAWIDAHAQRLGTTRIALEHACGRILAEQVIAPIDVPAFDRSAMDGYAL